LCGRAPRGGYRSAPATLAHDGAKAYADRFGLLYRREASRPNEIWQADHTPLDRWIVDERGQAARPWLSIIMDDYSRSAVGYAPPGSPRARPVLSLPELDARLRTFLVETHQQRVHSETGVAPKHAGKRMASCRACRSHPSNWICCC
jgi:hypothetical protein